MSVTKGGYQGITIYNGTTEFVSTRGIRDVSVSIEPEYVDLANGLRRPIAYRRTVSLTVVDHSIYDQLVTWAEALTAVQFVLVGQSKCLQGYDDTYINLVDQFTPFGDVNGFRIELVNTKYSPTWYTNTNLAWYAGWFDGDADNLPDSGEGTPSYEYSKTQTNITLTQSFNTSTSEFTVEIDSISNATNNAKLLLDIPFPFPGATVTFSADITDNTTGATVSVGLNPLNASGSGLGLVSTAVTANGRVSLTTTLPASTYYLRIFPVQIFNATIGVSELTQVTVKYPTLRVDGISAETLY
jgi:hypothetical protein